MSKFFHKIKNEALISIAEAADKAGRILKKRGLHLDACVGCGLCARKCPAHAIEMKNNRPVWVKKKCIMCLGCLHRCPAFAIQYGSGKTRKHGQYLNPHTKV